MQVLLFMLSSIFCVVNLAAQTQYLTIEPNHSTIGFEVDIASGATKVLGKFMEHDLQLTYVDKDWTKSTIHFTIKAASINTGIAGRDEHLRTADFFDVAKYPEITFASDTIELIDDHHFIAHGVFSMHGVHKQMAIPFEVTFEEEKNLGIKIETTLNRITYGVGADFQHTSIKNFLSDTIAVKIYFWTKRDKRKKE